MEITAIVKGNATSTQLLVMNRREFLVKTGKTGLMLTISTTGAAQVPDKRVHNSDVIKLFLCGDVMTGRGIDQILPSPSHPRIYESYVRDAREYVELAERLNGPIPSPDDFAYIWGDALEELERMASDVRLVNLETSVTTSDDYCQGKGINYRMHPANIACLTAAGIDCCVIANNHILDWGYEGLTETLKTLEQVKIKTAGAGRNLRQAAAPAVLEIKGKGRVLVFGFGSPTSGIPRRWAAARFRAGVSLLDELSEDAVKRISAKVQSVKQPGDIVVMSIHWGSNWGYEIPAAQRTFAHQLIDEAGVDVIHGHSSHHSRALEVYKGKPVLYGCGDFLNDYEGIGGYEEYRADLVLMYFISVDPASGELVRFDLTPMQIRRFSLNRVSTEDARWLCDTLDRESGQAGTRVEWQPDNRMKVYW